MKELTVLICILTLPLHSQSRFDQPTNQTYQSTYVPKDVDLYERAAKEKQRQQYELEIKSLNQTQKKIERLKKMYDDAHSYPNEISNGLHNVEITDGSSFSGSMQVYVQDNKITHMCNDGVKVDPVTFASKITNGKCLYRFNIPDSGESPYIDAYFIEDIYK